MFNEIFLGVSGLILICVCFSIIKKLHKENPGLSGFSKEKNTIKVFLFPEYSNVELALSNIGALISFYVMIIGTTLMTFGWGALVGVSCLLPFVFGFYLLQKIMCAFAEKRIDNITIAEYIHNNFSNKIFTYVTIIIMLVFSISTISTEVISLDLFSNALKIPYDELHNGKINSTSGLSIGTYLLFGCFLYVLFGGFKGVIKTDAFQMCLIILLWLLIAYLNLKNGSVVNLSLFKKHWSTDIESIQVATATSILIIGWILGAKDNWIRIFLYIENKKISCPNLSISDEKKIIKKYTAITCIAGMMIVLVPISTGLYMRDYVMNITCLDATQYDMEEKEFITNYSPLLTNAEDCHLKPSTNTSREAYIEQFTKFTNFPYIFFSYKINNDSGNHQYKIIFLICFLICIFAISLTTIDTLLILFSQLTNKINSNVSPYIPITFVFLSVFIVTNFLPDGTEEIYLSLGVFAWSNLIFLSSIHVMVSMFNDKVNNYLYSIIISWVLWAATIVILHFNAILDGGISSLKYDLMLERSLLPIFALLPSALIPGLYLLKRIIKP